MNTERRQHRSVDPAEAARLYLEHTAARFELAALAVADSDGLLVAGTRRGVDAEAVAAIAPLAALSGVTDGGLLDLVTRGQPLRVSGFDLGGERFYLASVGRNPPPAAEAAAAMGRILS